MTVAAEDTRTLSEHALEAVVEIQDVRVQPDHVTGMLVNLSGKIVRDVQVRIDRTWLWTNERHPGDSNDDPGRSVVYAVPGKMQPGGRLAFTYRFDTPAPQRTDGRFETSVSVVSLEQAG